VILQPSTVPRRRSRELLWGLAAVVPGLLAAALASIAVRRSFSLAEIERVFETRRPWRSLVPFDPADPSGALYQAALKGWLHLGSQEWVARVPSIAAFALTAFVVCMLGSRLFDRRVGLVAGTVFATTAFSVGLARAAGPLPLAVLAVTVATWLLVRALESDAIGWWSGYVVAAVAAVYLHASAAPVLTAHACAVVLWPRELRRRQAFTAVPVAGATVAALVPAVLHRRHLVDALAQPSLTDIGRTVHDVVGRNGVLLALAAAGVLALLLLRFPRAEPWKTTLLVAAAVLPPAAALTLSMLRPSLDARYLAVSVPAWSLLAAAGLRMLRLEVAAVALAGLLALAGLRLVDEVRKTPENWRAAVTRAFAVKEPGDRLVAAPARAISAVAFYAGPGRGSLTPGGPTTFVLARARDATTALYEGRHVVLPPAYALRDSTRFGGNLWLQRWERTGLR
jgi:uncharacterized membrane protein